MILILEKLHQLQLSTMGRVILPQRDLTQRGVVGASRWFHPFVDEPSPYGPLMARGYLAENRCSTEEIRFYRSSGALRTAPATRALSLRIAFVCSCETRDSVTPRTSPISRSVSSS